MIESKTTIKFTNVFIPKKFVSETNETIQNFDALVIRAYKQEAPVDRSDVRRNVKTQNRFLLGFDVGTRVLSLKGFDYALALITGTGKYRGGRDDGYTTGKVRASGFYGFGNRKDMVGFFVSRARRGIKSKGIKPNKFTERAKNKTEEKVINAINKTIKKLDSQYGIQETYTR